MFTACRSIGDGLGRLFCKEAGSIQDEPKCALVKVLQGWTTAPGAPLYHTPPHSLVIRFFPLKHSSFFFFLFNFHPARPGPGRRLLTLALHGSVLCPFAWVLSLRTLFVLCVTRKDRNTCWIIVAGHVNAFLCYRQVSFKRVSSSPSCYFAFFLSSFIVNFCLVGYNNTGLISATIRSNTHIVLLFSVHVQLVCHFTNDKKPAILRVV